MPRPSPINVDEESTAHVVDLGWTKVGYNEVGSGAPLVLIHGGGLGATSWSNYILNMGALSEHFRVIAMDCPGYGKSEPWKPTGENRSTVNARAVKGLADAMALDKISIIGNSMGGSTALTYAVDYPDRTNKIITMGTAPVGQRSAYASMFPTHGLRVLSTLADDPSFENFRRVFDLMIFNPSLVPDDVLKRRAESIDEAHRLNRLAERHVVQKARSLMDDLPNLECPVMLIHGRNDNMVPVEISVMLLPYLQNAELHVFNNCGHWAQYEQASRFNQLSLDFLLADS